MQKVVKPLVVTIYVIYLYLIGWRFFMIELYSFRESSMTGNGNVFHFVQAIVLLLFGVLLYVNLVAKNIRSCILNSFLTACVIMLYQSPQSAIIVAILIAFALTMTVFEFKKADK